MENKDQEMARRLLSAVIDRLETSVHSDAAKAQVRSIEARSSSNGTETVADGSNPIIFIIVNQPPSTALPAKVPEASSERIYGLENNNLRYQISDAVADVHPGLERFAVAETDSKSSAPKTCFIEPDRPCVRSGACEMRGH